LRLRDFFFSFFSCVEFTIGWISRKFRSIAIILDDENAANPRLAPIRECDLFVSTRAYGNVPVTPYLRRCTRFVVDFQFCNNAPIDCYNFVAIFPIYSNPLIPLIGNINFFGSYTKVI